MMQTQSKCFPLSIMVSQQQLSFQQVQFKYTEDFDMVLKNYYTEDCITNLLPNFIFVVFAPAYFRFESRPSSGNYKPFRRTQRIWKLIYIRN